MRSTHQQKNYDRRRPSLSLSFFPPTLAVHCTPTARLTPPERSLGSPSLCVLEFSLSSRTRAFVGHRHLTTQPSHPRKKSQRLFLFPSPPPPALGRRPRARPATSVATSPRQVSHQATSQPATKQRCRSQYPQRLIDSPHPLMIANNYMYNNNTSVNPFLPSSASVPFERQSLNRPSPEASTHPKFALLPLFQPEINRIKSRKIRRTRKKNIIKSSSAEHFGIHVSITPTRSTSPPFPFPSPSISIHTTQRNATHLRIKPLPGAFSRVVRPASALPLRKRYIPLPIHPSHLPRTFRLSGLRPRFTTTSWVRIRSHRSEATLASVSPSRSTGAIL
ncbi:hypothetical protein SCHPADRAFT_594618 [Schizopora paradoxa]|uniref:Uncharacterized protein n=1 Tax=Schizopora paradoxa TaxID=27342 RepID=A0A0H2RAE4_9AGAM|nr:hypothetical protein SCHPADRAFT_594618 [Schizopora paradoxa]